MSSRSGKLTAAELSEKLTTWKFRKDWSQMGPLMGVINGATDGAVDGGHR